MLKLQTDGFPTLMGHKSGSVFIVSQMKDKYFATCLSPDVGDYSFGEIIQLNKIALNKTLKEMPKNFFIEITRIQK